MNYYNIFDISIDASQNDIKRAYYAAVRKSGPDKDPEKFKQLRSAYETLKDPNLRKKYDKLLTYELDDEVKEKMLMASDLIERHQYKQVIDMLTVDKKPIHEESKINLQLAKAYINSGKTGMADKLLKQIVQADPSEINAYIMLGVGSMNRGHVNKAEEHFLKGLEIDNRNQELWGVYMDFIQEHYPWKVMSEIRHAFEIDKANLSTCYPLYLMGAVEALLVDDSRAGFELIDQFLQYFANDKNISKGDFETCLQMLITIAECPEARPLIARAIPLVKGCKYVSSEHNDKIITLEQYVQLDALMKDKRIHEIFHDLVELLIDFEDCKECNAALESMQLYIIGAIIEMRHSIRVIKNDYPKLYVLNNTFFDDVLDIKKERVLQMRLSKKMKRVGKTFSISDDESNAPYRRATPKVSRNDPCPCGSGKKFKQCCA